ncbi:hypothetical protein COV13_03060 [Candidatus Woesearchaeota archaeon CG10_big_fil_rev_8_21_14_0_10_32_9]|nr:MAG: hypothetical protein COV13_03060 [Candidatus Woesearchaeota archaeon CG10_big_fil_rev_8_21_14_0_10_32_9]
MKKLLLILSLLSILLISACSSAPDKLNSSEQVETILNFFVSNAVLMDNYSAVFESEDDYHVVLDNNNSMFFDKKTGIMYCLQEDGASKNCGSVYLAMINDSLLIDLEGLSCTPLINGTMDINYECDNSTIKEYYSLQDDLHRRKLFLPAVQK